MYDKKALLDEKINFLSLFKTKDMGSLRYFD